MLNLIKDTSCVQHCRTQIKKCKLKYQRVMENVLKLAENRRFIQNFLKKQKPLFQFFHAYFHCLVSEIYSL